MSVFLILAASVLGLLAGFVAIIAFDLSLIGAIALWILPGPITALVSVALPGSALRVAMHSGGKARHIRGAA